jgi:hypothetical protein
LTRSTQHAARESERPGSNRHTRPGKPLPYHWATPTKKARRPRRQRDAHERNASPRATRRGAPGQSGRPESNRHRRLGTPPPFQLGYDHELGLTTAAANTIRRHPRLHDSRCGRPDSNRHRRLGTPSPYPWATTANETPAPTRRGGRTEVPRNEAKHTKWTAGIEPAYATWQAAALPLGDVHRRGHGGLATKPTNHAAAEGNRRPLTVETGGLEPHTPGANRALSH